MKKSVGIWSALFLVISGASACGGTSDTQNTAGGTGGASAGAGGMSGGTSTGGAGAGGTGAMGGSATGGAGGGVGGTGGVGGGNPTGGAGGTGGTPMVNDRLGRSCTTDAECGVGLGCVAPDSRSFDGQGPAGGLCTADCAGNLERCSALDPTSVCLSFDNGNAFCIPGCTFGPTSLTSFASNKCHGRSDVACSPLTDNSGVVVPACIPQCNSDADCGALFCDPATGLCGTTPRAGDPVGAPCLPPAPGGAETCRGSCGNFALGTMGNTTSMCGERCTTGAGNSGQGSCGWNGPGTGPADAFCLFAFGAVIDNGGPGFGDLGSCAPLCSCNADCANTDLICNPVDNAAFTMTTGREGVCSDPTEPDGSPADEIDVCP